MSCIPIQDFSLISLCDATKAGKLYSIVPDTGAGDFDVTRASTATYLGSDGLLKTAANDEPRIEFNPDGSYKGLLVEPAATNLVLRSEEFDDAYWTKNNSTITANDAVAPDGTMTADKVTLTSDVGRVQVDIALPDNVLHTISIFVKNIDASNENVTLLLFNKSNTICRVSFEIKNSGQILNQSNATGQIESFSNGWYKLSLTFNTESGTNTPRIRFISNESATGGFTNGESVFIWGAQLETGSVATSYIPTVASTVTRAADVISKTGASALIGQTSGVIQLQADLITSDLNQTIAELYDDTDNYINIRKNDSNEIVATLVVAGSTVGTVTSAVQTSGKKDITFSYQTGTCTLSVNGVETTATATGVPATDKIKIGARQNDTEFWNSHVQVTALRPQL